MRIMVIVAFLLGLTANAAAEERTLLFGDTHLHTSYSLDAYMLGNASADPDTAFRYARGLPVIHPGHRALVRIDRPLDFLVVTDHAEFLGIMRELGAGNPELLAQPLGRRYYELLRTGRANEVFAEIVTAAQNQTLLTQLGELAAEPITRSIWADIVDTAERHNEPGRFTAFAGWEWSSMPDGRNLHRCILTTGTAEQSKQYLPFTSAQSPKPRDLWRWLAATAERTGADFVAIGHNPNLSLGSFFPLEDEDGRAIDRAYAELRERWEPVEEVTQYKGDSETHPILSPDDEFADFERYAHLLVGKVAAKPAPGAFARSGLLRGLTLSGGLGVNPYKFGMIGASDSHTALSSVQETAFLGKYARDSVPERKGETTTPGSEGWDASAQGLAAVWAQENSRQAIAEAFQRREVYATTGPRLQLRFFGGWRFVGSDALAPDLANRGYAKGVPMGADLAPAPAGGAVAPRFLVHAAKDPMDARLDRVQVVKGWLDAAGNSHERVYDVVWAGARSRDSQGRLPPVGNTVDLTTGTYRNTIGSDELATVWEDPDFAADQPAFYYARVLQIPVPRHTVYDTLALAEPVAASKHAAVLQERAYSSPIWYTPPR